jgi:hypothetical protein
VLSPSSNILSIEVRSASARLIRGLSRIARKKPVVRPTVASLATLQLLTRSERAPA